MKQPASYLLTLSLFTVLVGCGDQSALEPRLEDELVAVTDTGTETGQLVPLRGRFEGGGANFSGTLTHLGRFEGVFDAVTNTAVWRAADGDTLTNQTISFVLGEQVSSGVFRYAQELTLTGGTGRFANASGSATVTGLIDLTTGAYDGRVEGYVSRPNSR